MPTERFHRGLIWVMVGSSILIVALAAIFETRLTTHGGWYCRCVWEVWELAGLAWSILIVFYYFIDYELAGRSDLDKTTLFILCFFCASMPGVGIYYLLRDYQPLVPIALGVALNLVYCGLDLFLAVHHPKSEKRQSYHASFLIADMPMVIASFVFFVWLLYHFEGEWVAFASGLVAFQLLTCNWIFLVTQSGLMRTMASATGSAVAQGDGT